MFLQVTHLVKVSVTVIATHVSLTVIVSQILSADLVPAIYIYNTY